MKTTLKRLCTVALARIIYLAAMYRLRSLEITLHDTCNALPHVTCIQTRADMALAIRQLSLAVVEARNQVAKLNPATRQTNRWRLA